MIFPYEAIPFVNEFPEQINVLSIVQPITFKFPPTFTFADIPAPPLMIRDPDRISCDSKLDVNTLCVILNVPRQIKFPPTPTVKFPPFSTTMLLLRILLCIVPFTTAFPETVRVFDTILPPTNKLPAILAPPKDTIAP